MTSVILPDAMLSWVGVRFSVAQGSTLRGRDKNTRQLCQGQQGYVGTSSVTKNEPHQSIKSSCQMLSRRLSEQSHSPHAFITPLTHHHQVVMITLHYTCCRCSVMSKSLQPHGLWLIRHLWPWDFPGKNTRVGCHFLLQRIFLIKESKPHLLHYRWILYHWANWH